MTVRAAYTPRSSTYESCASPSRTPETTASPLSLSAAMNTESFELLTDVALSASVATVSLSTTVISGSLRTTAASAANAASIAAPAITNVLPALIFRLLLFTNN